MDMYNRLDPLTPEDKENIGFIFQEEITRNRQEARLRHLEGEISAEKLEWHLKHATYLEATWKKLAAILNA